MIKFYSVSLKYNNDAYAIKDLSLKIDEGEFVFIVGKTGAGKSTLFKLLTRELKPTSGTIKVFNDDIDQLSDRLIPYYRRQLGVVFQDFKLLEDRNAYENIAFAQEVIGASSFKIKKRVMRLLNIVDLKNKAYNMPSALYGGEKQKVAIARALINKPKILLADEPTGNLDEISTNEIMSLLDIINKNGTTVVVITHDMRLVERMNKRVIKLDEGNIVYDDVGLDEQIKAYMDNE